MIESDRISPHREPSSGSRTGGLEPPPDGNHAFTFVDRIGGAVVSKTEPEYTVKNIVAIIAAMLFAVAIAIYSFLGKSHRGSPAGMGLLFIILAVYLAMHAIRGIRSRRR